MKKIGLWMAALTAVTVGGVYATWTYAEKSVTNIDSEEQIIQVAGINTSEDLKVGALSIQASPDFSLSIDSASYLYPVDEDAEAGYQDYKARGYHQHEAVMVVKGSITVTFTASELASDNIKTNGLLTDIYFSTPKNINLSSVTWPIGGETPIFTFNALTHRLGGADDASDGAKWEHENGTLVFTYTYTNEELQTLFTLQEDIVLDSSAKHAEFSAEVAGVSATLHVVHVE